MNPRIRRILWRIEDNWKAWVWGIVGGCIYALFGALTFVTWTAGGGS